jgi:hypothetical protein
MSNAQVASIGCVLAGVVLLLWASKRNAVPAGQPAIAVEKPA